MQATRRSLDQRFSVVRGFLSHLRLTKSPQSNGRRGRDVCGRKVNALGLQLGAGALIAALGKSPVLSLASLHSNTPLRALPMGAETAMARRPLVPLRTKDEVRASLETHTVYVVEIPARFANTIKE